MCVVFFDKMCYNRTPEKCEISLKWPEVEEGAYHMEVYPAHIRYNNETEKMIQTVSEHCRNSARLAQLRAGPDLGHTAYLAGLLHDMGKYTEEYRAYIEAAAAKQKVRRGSVNHTYAGVRFILERWHRQPFLKRLTCELLAVAVGSHHGLFDIFSKDGADGFLKRLQKEGIHYDEAKAAFLEQCAEEQELDALFCRAFQEVDAVVQKFYDTFKNLKEEEMHFYVSLLARFLMSAVMDGDRRDTAGFMCGAETPVSDMDQAVSWDLCRAHVEQYLSRMDGAQKINRVRRDISDQCLQAADRPEGIYRLSLPTGSGKTLTSLRYALAAAQGGKRRILFVIPLLSVLEQNAAVIREAVGDDAVILEHHSNVVRESPKEDELDPNELFLENWDSPILITTLVQLLDTLFSGKTSCIRRMSALQNCVLIIDEVQTVPRNMLTLFNMAMNWLATVMHATVVLCSATQPALEQTAHPIAYAPEPELVSHCAAWEVFRRTEIVDLRMPYGYTAEQLAELVQSCAQKHGSVLLVCNKKSEARSIYQLLDGEPDTVCYHLSTSMCMAHRIRVLQAVDQSLRRPVRTICISTQLVEAGVDFSFGCVIRILAGLDHVVQAAGRCNRHGEKGALCPVYLVNLQGENLSRLPEIQDGQRACEDLLERFAAAPEEYDSDLVSGKAIQKYYEILYGQLGPKTADYPLPDGKTTLFQLLSQNTAYQNKSSGGGSYAMRQAFQTAGQAFSVFLDDTTDVLVPFQEGAEIIANLLSQRGQRDFQFRMEQIRKARQYTVSLFPYEIRELERAGGLFGEEICCMKPEFYSDAMGFCLHAGGGYGEFV